MKIVLYVKINDLEYLNNILKDYSSINIKKNTCKFSFAKFKKSAMIILTFEQLTFLIDNNVIKTN